ncbi:MAG: aminotransferase class IV [Eubacteriales bacterium]|nr:aminotransferase class IV [Eubacteriales bacterium]
MLIINGQRAESDRSTNLAFDEGLAFGRGAFETLPVHDQPFWLDQHLERLNRTLTRLGISRQVAAAEILSQVQENHIRNQTVKIIVTPENLILATRPLPSPVPGGQRLLLHAEGHPLRAPLAGLKTLNYLGLLLVREQAQASGWQDALLVTDQGQVLETTTANVFIIQGNQIRTPQARGDLLPGIVRQFVLDLDQSWDLSIQEGPVTCEDLRAAEGVFVTNSLVGIQPVREVGRTGDSNLYPDPFNSRAFRAINAAYQAAQNEVGIHA